MTTTSSTSATGSSSILSSLGIGSGLDVTSIINSLVTADSAPLTALQTAYTGYQTEISEYGQISSAYSQLQGAIQGLQASSAQNSLLGLSASSSTTSVATSSITGPATLGNYNLNVSSLAQGEQLVSIGGNASNSTPITTTDANISIQLGAISGGTKNGNPATYTGATYTPNGAPTVIKVKAGSSLSDIASDINNSNSGVSASLIFDGSKYRLTLSSQGTGVNTAINISSFGDTALASLVNQDPSGIQNFQETQTASDLSATLNGIAITGNSNTLTNTISGLSINVTQTGSTSISVGQDASQAQAALGSFVTAWNGLNGLIKSLTSYDATTQTAGPLLGDPLAAPAFFSLTNSTFGKAADASLTGSNTYNTLASVGISVDSTGAASIDSSKLTAALKASPNALANLFSTTKGNILQNASDAVGSILGKNGITGLTDSLTSQMAQNQKQQTSWNDRLTQIRANLTAQYTAMDTAVAKFQSTSSYLTNQLNANNNSSN